MKNKKESFLERKKIFLNKKNVLNLFLLILLIVIANFTVASCKNRLEDPKFELVELSISPDDSSSNARSMHPNNKYPETWWYQAVAEEINDSGFLVSNGHVKKSSKKQFTAGSKKLTLSLYGGRKYRITLNAYTSQTSSNPVASGIHKNLNIQYDTTVDMSGIRIKLKASKVSQEKGSLKIKLKFPNTVDDIQRLTIGDSGKLKDLPVAPSLSYNSSTRICTIQASNISPNINDLSSGSSGYSIKLKLLNSDAKLIGYFYVNEIYIYPGRETNSITGSDTVYDFDHPYTVEEKEIIIQKHIYLDSSSSTADDSNSGTYLHPVKNLQAAIDKCVNPNVEYVISISGDLNSSGGLISSKPNSCAVITGNKKITIRGALDNSGSHSTTSLDATGLSKRLLEISGDSEVTLMDIKIENGGGSSFGNGGGILLKTATLSLKSNCIIEGNRVASAKNGSCIYCTSGAKLNIYSSAKVDINNDIYLTNGCKINIPEDKALTQTTVAKITPETYPEDDSTVVSVLSGTGFNKHDNWKKFQVTDDKDGYSWEVLKAGNLEMKPLELPKVGSTTPWVDLKTAVEHKKYRKIKITGQIEAPAGAEQIEVSRKLEIFGNISGTSSQLSANKQCRIFKIMNSGDLTISKLILTKGEPKNADDNGNGGAVYIAGGGSFTLGGYAKIYDNKAKCGGAVYISTGGTFNMKKASFIGLVSQPKNIATQGGGGVCIYGGTFNMTGGTINENTVGADGGSAVYIFDGACNIGDTENTCTIRKDISFKDGSLKLDGKLDFYKGEIRLKNVNKAVTLTNNFEIITINTPPKSVDELIKLIPKVQGGGITSYTNNQSVLRFSGVDDDKKMDMASKFYIPPTGSDPNLLDYTIKKSGNLVTLNNNYLKGLFGKCTETGDCSNGNIKNILNKVIIIKTNKGNIGYVKFTKINVSVDFFKLVFASYTSSGAPKRFRTESTTMHKNYGLNLDSINNPAGNGNGHINWEQEFGIDNGSGSNYIMNVGNHNPTADAIQPKFWILE